MQDLTKVVLFVISLPLSYFVYVHNCWQTKKQEREKEICQADQDWAKEVRQAEQERESSLPWDEEWAGELCKAEQECKQETLDQKWVQSDQNRYAAGIMNVSGGIFGFHQRKFGNWLIQVKHSG